MASPLVLAVHPAMGVANVSDLIRYAKSRSTPLVYSTPGNGTLHHLSMVWLMSQTGLSMTHVPYKGNQSTMALISGEVSVAFVSVLSGLPHIKSGRMKAIAVTSHNRSRVLPELPTVAESVKGFEATNWFGVVAPRGTPAQIVSKLSGLIAAYVATPEARERILNSGADPVGSTPAEFANVIRTELARWGTVVKTAGVKVE